ncbi:auxin response factor 4-like, partial [Lotus japonicus]|uniref:auxin response factor 4-like n=1 Tax=Lotus japonicus TaxID=34305 RepID=UPI00258B3307
PSSPSPATVAARFVVDAVIVATSYVLRLVVVSFALLLSFAPCWFCRGCVVHCCYWRLRSLPYWLLCALIQDYKQQRPSQELVAKDLHGVEWKFCHIYRGQPRWHLLTTGWSIFVSQKNLVSGDAVPFLRDENGELRLGIRRSVRPRNGILESIVGNQNYYPNILSSVANAISTRSMFHVFYSPRCFRGWLGLGIGGGGAKSFWECGGGRNKTSHC